MGNIINKSGADYSKNFPEIVEFSFRFFHIFYFGAQNMFEISK
jgi:hypothetical protein